MKQIGALDEYNCGVIYRIECWLETMGIEFEINPKISNCVMHEKGACSGDIRVMLNNG